MHIYVFGSLCRGEVDTASDVDLLAVTDGFDKRLNPDCIFYLLLRSYSSIMGGRKPIRVAPCDRKQN